MKRFNLFSPVLITAGALCGAAAFSQSPTVPVAPPSPPLPSAVLAQGNGRNFAPRPFRMMAPVGMSANFTYATATSHKAELGVTDAQVTQLDALRQKFFDDRTKRMSTMQSLQQQVQTLSETEPVDMAKIESLVRQLSTVRGDDTLADIRLNEAYKKILTADQRAKMKDMAPEFPAMMPPHMPMNGGSMPGMPGMPGMGGMAGMRGMPQPALNPGGQPGSVPTPKQPLAPPPPPAS